VTDFGLRQHHKSAPRRTPIVPQDETERRFGPRAGGRRIRISAPNLNVGSCNWTADLVIRIAERGPSGRNRLVAAALAD
jgi:hypothetical protein